MFNEKQLIQAIALTRLFDIKELVLDSNFVNSEIGKKNLHEYKERVIILVNQKSLLLSTKCLQMY